MQSVKIERTNGNIPRSLAGEDHISGLLFYSSKLPSGFGETDRIKAISNIETAEKLGITSDADADWDIRVLHYQLRSIFNRNPAISLYVGIYKPTSGTPTFSEIKTMQNFTGGKIRQIGVWDGATALDPANLITLQAIRTTLEAQDKPLSIGYAPKIAAVSGLPTNLAGANKNGVSVIIGQDGAGTAADLYKDAKNTAKSSVTAIGEWLGIVSAAAVHESIAWVEKFPTGIALPAFGDGTLLRDLDTAVIESLDAARYIFFVEYSGLAGAYFNDSHTMDDATSDYAYIESVRTMDKACRNVRTYVLPKLGRPMKVDASTGKLEAYVVEDLQLTAGKALEDMEKAGELSGYVVEIDPDQNILSTSCVEMVIKQVGVGVMRKLNIKIGYTTSV
ncbi:MAG: DUF2586 family protein [Alistipes sp.]|nr:DUF2586 family protein [Alistipes sp.]